MGALSYQLVASVSFDNSSNRNGKYAIKDNCLYETQTGTLLYGNVNSIIPSEVTSIANYAFRYQNFEGNFVIPGNVKNMALMPFYYCSFESLTVEEGVEDLHFFNCTTKQKEFIVPGSVKVIGSINQEYSHYGLKGMEKIILSEGVEALTSVLECEAVLPSTIKDAVIMLRECTKGVTVYEGYRYYGDTNNPYYVLLGPDNENSPSELLIHKDTKVIARGALYGKKLTSITFGDSLEYICKAAFFRALDEYEGVLTIPNTVKYIGDSAFFSESYNSEFTLVLGTGVESVGSLFINAERYNYAENCTWYGCVGYLSSVDNPYHTVITFDPYRDSSYDGNTEPVYQYHKDTEIIAERPTYNWGIMNYEGTVEEFLQIFVDAKIVSEIKEYDWAIINCTDGVISADTYKE